MTSLKLCMKLLCRLPSYLISVNDSSDKNKALHLDLFLASEYSLSDRGKHSKWNQIKCHELSLIIQSEYKFVTIIAK